MNSTTLYEVRKLYSSGLSAAQIKNKLLIPITVRSIQRALAKNGLTRTRIIAYNMAVKEGRVGAIKKLNTIKRLRLPAMLRYMILKRDEFRCVLCGATAKDRLLEIDHKDFNVNNNDPENLQTLCEWCNAGRRHNIA